MPFQKGHKINLGRKHSKEAKEKMSQSQMGLKSALKNGDSPYKNYHIMQKARIELLKRTKGKCETCGERGLCIHHIDGSNTNHDIENLMFLCQHCHSFLHAKFNEEGKQVKSNTKHIRKYGMTLEEMGKIFGVTRETIRLWTNSPEKEKWLREKLGLSG